MARPPNDLARDLAATKAQVAPGRTRLRGLTRLIRRAGVGQVRQARPGFGPPGGSRRVYRIRGPRVHGLPHRARGPSSPGHEADTRRRRARAASDPLPDEGVGFTGAPGWCRGVPARQGGPPHGKGSPVLRGVGYPHQRLGDGRGVGARWPMDTAGGRITLPSGPLPQDAEGGSALRPTPLAKAIRDDRGERDAGSGLERRPHLRFSFDLNDWQVGPERRSRARSAGCGYPGGYRAALALRA